MLENIPKRNSPTFPHSFFVVTLTNDEVVNESEYSWKDISIEAHPLYKDGNKTVFTCTLPVKTIAMTHRNLSISLAVTDGQLCYQSIISKIVVVQGHQKTLVVGRIFGIIEDGRIIEEYRFEDNLQDPIIYKYEQN